MKSIAEQVRTIFRNLPPGRVIATAELRHLAEDSQQVDKAVSRIFKQAGLEKLRNGLYYKSLDSKYFGLLPPCDSAIVKSVKRQYDARLVPSGALAAFELGFTDKAPEEKIYDTNKRIAAIVTCNTKISFRQVQGKKIFSANLKLVTLLNALEFLFKQHPTLNYLQQQFIKRQLERHSYQHIEKALLHWPRWFRDKTMAFAKPDEVVRYITGISAFNIPYNGQVADWHQVGMFQRNKFQISNINYHGAPDVMPDELFDCETFLNKYRATLPVSQCAKPVRAIKDMLYSNIILNNRYPHFLILDQFMLSISRQDIRLCVDDLRCYANHKQMTLLDQWLDENDVN